MRSFPSPSGALVGYVLPSIIQIRPRSSKHMAMGWTKSGSLATTSTSKPFGKSMFLADSDGLNPIAYSSCGRLDVRQRSATCRRFASGTSLRSV